MLRQRCIIAVSQDPLLLSNETLRFNLDPEVSIPDESLVDALTKVGLWYHFSKSGNTQVDQGRAATITMPIGSSGHMILDQRLSLFHELSAGQCELFALCRALVKVNSLRRSGVKPVIVLDEVTSALDPATESIIYRIIDDEFTAKGHTVIIVAHRLGVLEKHIQVGRDAVALMGDGRLLRTIETLNAETIEQLAQIDQENAS